MESITEYYFRILDNTTVEEVECYLINIFTLQVEFKLVIDISNVINYMGLLRFKEVLDKYRLITRQYLISTKIYITNIQVFRELLLILLKIFKPEKPISIDFLD